MAYKSVPIRQDPYIRGVLKRMAPEVRTSFSDGQLVALKSALGAKSWGVHPVDIRKTIGFWKLRYYIVFLMGKEKRPPERRTKQKLRLTELIFLTITIIFMIVVGFALLYLAKSALGIDMVEGQSTGFWDLLFG